MVTPVAKSNGPVLPGCNDVKGWAKGDAAVAAFFTKVWKVPSIAEVFTVSAAVEGAYALLGGCLTQ